VKKSRSKGKSLSLLEFATVVRLLEERRDVEHVWATLQATRNKSESAASEVKRISEAIGSMAAAALVSPRERVGPSLTASSSSVGDDSSLTDAQARAAFVGSTSLNGLARPSLLPSVEDDVTHHWLTTLFADHETGPRDAFAAALIEGARCMPVFLSATGSTVSHCAGDTSDGDVALPATALATFISSFGFKVSAAHLTLVVDVAALADADEAARDAAIKSIETLRAADSRVRIALVQQSVLPGAHSDVARVEVHKVTAVGEAEAITVPVSDEAVLHVAFVAPHARIDVSVGLLWAAGVNAVFMAAGASDDAEEANAMARALAMVAALHEDTGKRGLVPRPGRGTDADTSERSRSTISIRIFGCYKLPVPPTPEVQAATEAARRRRSSSASAGSSANGTSMRNSDPPPASSTRDGDDEGDADADLESSSASQRARGSSRYGRLASRFRRSKGNSTSDKHAPSQFAKDVSVLVRAHVRGAREDRNALSTTAVRGNAYSPSFSGDHPPVLRFPITSPEPAVVVLSVIVRRPGCDDVVVAVGAFRVISCHEGVRSLRMYSDAGSMLPHTTVLLQVGTDAAVAAAADASSRRAWREYSSRAAAKALSLEDYAARYKGEGGEAAVALANLPVHVARAPKVDTEESASTLVREGWLVKLGGKKRDKGWQKRYVRLYQSRMLYYGSASPKAKPKGELILVDVEFIFAAMVDGGGLPPPALVLQMPSPANFANAIEVVTGSRTFVLVASSTDILRDWTRSLRETVSNAKRRYAKLAPTAAAPTKTQVVATLAKAVANDREVPIVVPEAFQEMIRSTSKRGKEAPTESTPVTSGRRRGSSFSLGKGSRVASAVMSERGGAGAGDTPSDGGSQRSLSPRMPSSLSKKKGASRAGSWIATPVVDVEGESPGEERDVALVETLPVAEAAAAALSALRKNGESAVELGEGGGESEPTTTGGDEGDDDNEGGPTRSRAGSGASIAETIDEAVLLEGVEIETLPDLDEERQAVRMPWIEGDHLIDDAVITDFAKPADGSSASPKKGTGGESKLSKLRERIKSRRL
jgi:hypothetical protein